MGRASRMLRGAAPQLVGFGLGMGLFSYIERYGRAPPQLVAETPALLACHEQLLAARLWFPRAVRSLQAAFGGGGAAGGAAAVEEPLRKDPHRLLREAKRLADGGDGEGCARKLGELFLDSDTPRFVQALLFGADGVGAAAPPAEGAEPEPAGDPFHGEPELPWLVRTVPVLWREKRLVDLEALVMANWLMRIDAPQLMKTSRDLVVRLPMRILKAAAAADEAAAAAAAEAGEGAAADKTTPMLACTLLTHASAVEARELYEKRQRNGWFSFLRPTPRSAVAEELAADPAVLRRIVGWLPDSPKGLDFVGVLLLRVLNSNRAHAKKLAECGALEATVGALVDGFGSFGADGAARAAPGAGNLATAPALLNLLSNFLAESQTKPTAEGNAPLLPGVFQALPAAVHQPLADAVFRTTAANFEDPSAVASGLHILACLTNDQDGMELEAPVSKAWLVEKGLILACAQCVSAHGGHDEALYQTITTFLLPYMLDADVREKIPDEQSEILSKEFHKALYGDDGDALPEGFEVSEEDICFDAPDAEGADSAGAAGEPAEGSKE